MADTTTVTLSSGNISFDILAIKIEHDFDRQISELSIPKSTDSKNTCPITTTVKQPLNYAIDLVRLRQSITITGYLLEETGSSALTKKDALEVLVCGGANNKALELTLQWTVGTTTITKYGSIIKTKITELPMRIGDEHPVTQNKSLQIQLVFMVGSIKG